MKHAKTILFDLDSTLFDHHHSLHAGLLAIQSRFPGLSHIPVDKLADVYNRCLETAYSKYLKNEIKFVEVADLKFNLLYEELGLSEPDSRVTALWEDVYKPAYRESMKATAGSLETLENLKDKGYILAIVTNGQKDAQIVKARAVGAYESVDGRIFTSQEAGAAKPNARLFEFAFRQLEVGSDEKPGVWMVGDSIEADIEGAIRFGITPILYDPTAKDNTIKVLTEEIRIIRNMAELPGLVGAKCDRKGAT